jgi:hypothetical protein
MSLQLIERLRSALQSISEESTDLDARECALEALNKQALAVKSPTIEFTKGDTYQSGDDNHFASGIDHLTTDANSMSPLGVCSDPRKPAKTWFQRIVCYGQDAEQAYALRDRLLAALAVCDGKGHYVDPNKLEPITPSCLEYAQRARAAWSCRENEGFAVEMAYQYGASHIDDDAELLVMTSENLINLMAALGFDQRKPGPRCVVCPPDESFKCQTCHDQGEIYSGENQSFGCMSMQPPEPIMDTCPECNGDSIEPASAGGVDERAAFIRDFKLEGRIYYDANTHRWLPSRDSVEGFKLAQRVTTCWAGWVARAALSAPSHGEQVREGWVLTELRRPIEWADADGTVEVQVSDGSETSTAIFYKKAGAMGWKRLGMNNVTYWKPLAAAPSAVSQEQGE